MITFYVGIQMDLARWAQPWIWDFTISVREATRLFDEGKTNRNEWNHSCAIE